MKIFSTRYNRRQISLGIAGSLAASSLSDAVSAKAASTASTFERFVVYYGHHAAPALNDYALQVLDSDIAPQALALESTSLRLCYLSVGEVSKQRSYHAKLASLGMLGRANPNWPDANYIDVREDRWHTFLIQELIPDLLARGFGGLFLDTLDNAEYLELTFPTQYQGMMKAAGALITGIRKNFPAIKIMINRGYGTLPLIAGQFDMLLGEFVVSRFTPDRRYEFLSRNDVEWQKAQMYAARKRDPALGLYSLDYWLPDDGDKILSIYETERKNGFVPYVATWDLGTVLPVPGGYR